MNYMSKDFELLYDFDDILIEPAISSDIKSRSEISARYDNEKLPLITAPMDTVICKQNETLFRKMGFTTVLPRIPTPKNNYYNTNLFYSYSHQDFDNIFVKNKIEIPENNVVYALIDVANGHMQHLIDTCGEAKIKYGNSLCLMVGNVANPQTFINYCEIGVDMVRIGIGNGNGCLTTVQTGVGYPMAALIKECYEMRGNEYTTKIVADGGFKKYSDVIKGLALGADYIMLGSVLNKALESCGETTREDGEIIDQYTNSARQLFDADISLFKTFRGMSTKEVQKEWGKKELTTSEGVIKRNKVEYTLFGWVRNFEDYLRSAMSYTGKRELRDFIGGVHYNLITENSFRRFDK